MIDSSIIASAMAAVGICPRELPEPEPGKVSRFMVEGDKPGSRNGWMTLFPDQAGAVFGSWRSGVTGTCFADGGGNRPHFEQARMTRLASELAGRAKREREREAAAACSDMWRKALPATDHPYLSKKQIMPHCARLLGEALLIPVLDDLGRLQSLQFIQPDGQKRFKSGGRMAGGRVWIGESEPVAKTALLLCEGFATGATLHEATGLPVVVAFNAGNLLAVARDVRNKYRRARIVICGDNDLSTDGNPGLTKASEAADAVNAELFLPPDEYGHADFNDLGLDETRTLWDHFEMMGAQQ